MDPVAVRVTPQLPIEVWQLVIDTVCDTTSYETFYSNQAYYRSWALVSRSWAACAQRVLFRIIELLETEQLHRFVTLLNDAPHLAAYVKTLRLYTRHLHTTDNVFALLPTIPKDRLYNLKSILLTRITEQDTWHPQASHAPSSKELEHQRQQQQQHCQTGREARWDATYTAAAAADVVDVPFRSGKRACAEERGEGDG